MYSRGFRVPPRRIPFPSPCARRRVPLPLLIVLGLCCSACATGLPVQREQLADGSHRLTCDTSLSECLFFTREVCREGYAVISAAEKLQRHGPEPWPSETLSSHAIVRCGSRPAPAGPSAAAPTTAVPPPCTPPTTATAAPAVPNAQAAPKPGGCFPGATQPCVGPGGCAGGQACSADGSAFGTCDCGQRPSPPAP
jgi:hypothetical protein